MAEEKDTSLRDQACIRALLSQGFTRGRFSQLNEQEKDALSACGKNREPIMRIMRESDARNKASSIETDEPTVTADTQSDH